MIDLQNIEKIIQRIFDEDVIYTPIGNHTLKRHLVYEVKNGKGTFVLKLYFLKDRQNREVGMLGYLASNNFMVPEVIDHGVISDPDLYHDPIEYMVCSWLPGQLMLDEETHMVRKDKETIYGEMGKLLARIHSICSFHFSGILNADGSFKQRYDLDKDYFTYEVARILGHLDRDIHDKPILIESARRAIKEELATMESPGYSVLCHNDFGPRNMLIDEFDGKYEITGLIDFEHSSISDGKRELTILYHRVKVLDEDLAELFLGGYKSVREVNLQSTERLYMLFRGLAICSWAKENAYDHYLEGVAILEKFL